VLPVLLLLAIVLSVLLLLAIVLSVLLRFTDSDYSFGILKLVLIKTKIRHLFNFVGYGTPVILLFVFIIEISLFWNVDLPHSTRAHYW